MSRRHHSVEMDLLNHRIAATRDEINLRKQSMVEIRQCLAGLVLQRGGTPPRLGEDDDGAAAVVERQPSQRRSISARLYPGPHTHKDACSNASTSEPSRPPLTPSEVVALGDRLCRAPSPTIAPCPKLDRTVITAAHFRADKQSKHRNAVQDAARFTDETAMRLASQDPARRKELQARRLDAVVQEVRKQCSSTATKSAIQKAVTRNYEAALLYSERHSRAVDAQLKRVDDTIKRTCALCSSASTAERLSSESAAAQKKREWLELEYADNFMPSGTAAARRAGRPAIPQELQRKLFEELSKGYGFEWRLQT